MGIDGIGKKGGAPPIDTGGVGQLGQLDKKGGVEKTFSVELEGTGKARSSGMDVGAVDASAPLARLRAGEVDVNGYVDLKVDEATKGLEGLPPSDLADLKTMLRDQIATDPGLIDLVTKATGSAASPPDE